MSKISDFYDAMPGMVFSFARPMAPAGFLACDGSTVSRSAYPGLFAAMSLAMTGSTTNASATVTVTGGVAVSNLQVGMPVCGPGVPAGTTVSGVNAAAGTFTLSANATATAAGVTLYACPWGVGDGSSTFSIPDYRGEFLRGFDITRGVDSGRVFGQFQANQLGQHNHGISDPGHVHSVPGGTGTGGGTNGAFSKASAGGNDMADFSNTTGITVNNAGGTSNGSETRPRNNTVLYCIKY